jgi:hypothetical protein
MGLMSLLNYPMAGFMVFLLSKGVGPPVLLKGFKPIRRAAAAYFKTASK